ncbi:MAG: sulfite exporter TauE/SafE family protein [Spongiibacteraceae bacterium]
MLIFTLCLIAGALAGFAAGLFGIGGGMVIVPALVFCFSILSLPESISMQLAIGTSLATIVVTSISSVRTHHQLGNVNWRVWRFIAPGIVLGVVLGVGSAAAVSSENLRVAFGIFAILIGLQMALGLSPGGARELPHGGGLSVAGVVIGYFSALFGIGGGSLTVPFLNWCKMRMQAAVATSAACGLPIAIVGAATNVVVGYGRPELPEYSAGFIYGPALLGLVICAAPCARFGALAAQKISAARLRQSFAAFQLFVGLQFIIGAL